MHGAIPSPWFAALLVLTLAVIAITIFAWLRTVRRTSPEIPPNPRPLVYAAIGASDVEGVGARDPATESWVNVVHEALPQGTRFVRLGRGGITLEQAAGVEVPRAIEARPELVTMWNCVNDAVGGVPLDRYASVLDRVLRDITRATQANVLLLNLPNVALLLEGKVPATQLEMVEGGLRLWNEEIGRVAANFGDHVRVLDLFPLSDEVRCHPEYISSDGFHPATEGYRRLGETVVQALERAGWLPDSSECPRANRAEDGPPEPRP